MPFFGQSSDNLSNMRTFTTIGALLFVLLGFSAASSAQEARTWTLRDCIDYALEHNIQIQTQELTRQTSEVSLEQARAAQYPTLNFSTSFGANSRMRSLTTTIWRSRAASRPPTTTASIPA